MWLAKLREHLNQSWPAIAKAEGQAQLQIDRIRRLILQSAAKEGSLDSEDISLVVFGSLARQEWTSGSDLDWTLLIDGEADHGHAETARRLESLLREAGFIAPGPTGTFGNLAFSHSLVHQIGGHDDTNRNTTQRMLLLLESRPINRTEAYYRVIRGIVKRYLTNDFRAFRLKVPRFLLNDVHRFWRTMCVDYASKYRERAAEGWALRNVKLRMSRKLIFAAGLIICYSCDPDCVAQRNPTLHDDPTVEGMVCYLEEFANRTPLDILAEVLVKLSTTGAEAQAARTLIGAYDQFLTQLDDPDKRDQLKKLSPEDAQTNKLYREVQTQCSTFESALEQLFFDNPYLARLTRKYGVF
jgi:predicted nucleotidyltransferase